MRRRGFSLLELMIAVAIAGIAVVAGSAGVGQLSRMSADALHRERALQVLEYEASARVAGKRTDPMVRRRLLSELPRGSFTATQRSTHVELEVHWWVDHRRHEQTLALVGVSP